VDFISAPSRPVLPRHGDERTQLTAWLDYYRATLLMKCDGLRLEQLTARPVATSALTLLGLLRHMAAVEQYWFEDILEGRDVQWYIDNEEDPDADFNDLSALSLMEVADMFDRACVTSRDIVAQRSLDDSATRDNAAWGGEKVDTRWVMIHMIEEYARHVGHADFLRELIDGATGY